MEQQTTINFNQVIWAIKDAILKSRYRAAMFVNRELISLYYGIGKFISENSRKHFGEQMLSKPYQLNYSMNFRI